MKARLETMSKCHTVLFMGVALGIFVLVAAASAAVPEIFLKREGHFITCKDGKQTNARLLQSPPANQPESSSKNNTEAKNITESWNTPLPVSKTEKVVHEDGLECAYLKDGHYWEARITNLSPKNQALIVKGYVKTDPHLLTKNKK